MTDSASVPRRRKAKTGSDIDAGGKSKPHHTRLERNLHRRLRVVATLRNNFLGEEFERAIKEFIDQGNKKRGWIVPDFDVSDSDSADTASASGFEPDGAEYTAIRITAKSHQKLKVLALLQSTDIFVLANRAVADYLAPFFDKKGRVIESKLADG